MKPSRLAIAAFTLSLSALAAHAQEGNALRIGTEGAYAPYTFINADGVLTGFDVEVAQAVCERMEVECTIEAAAWDNLIPSLESGRFDALFTGMRITAERLEAIDFSAPYGYSFTGFITSGTSDLASWTAGGRIDLGGGDNSENASVSEAATALTGSRVGGTGGGSSRWFQAAFPDIEFVQYGTLEQVELDLLAGRIDVAVGLTTAWDVSVEAAGDGRLVRVGPAYYGGMLGGGIAAGVAKGNEELANRITAAIQSMRDDGSLSEISIRWFGSDETEVN